MSGKIYRNPPVMAQKWRHIEDEQERYVFTSVEQLIADFLGDVRAMRGEL
jgi:hypothetical protein